MRSTYKRTKNSRGDPQNYKLILSLNIELISDEKNKVNENFERIKYLTAQSKKLNEIEEEKSKKKENLIITVVAIGVVTTFALIALM